MRIESLSIALICSFFLGACSSEAKDLNNEKFKTITTSISIQIPGGLAKPGISASIYPNGTGSYKHTETETEFIGANGVYEEVVELLGPLKNYSGSIHNPANSNKVMKCDSFSGNEEFAIIIWDIGSKDDDQRPVDLSNISNFHFGCQSEIAEQATSRIKSALAKIEKHASMNQ